MLIGNLFFGRLKREITIIRGGIAIIRREGEWEKKRKKKKKEKKKPIEIKERARRGLPNSACMLNVRTQRYASHGKSIGSLEYN